MMVGAQLIRDQSEFKTDHYQPIKKRRIAFLLTGLSRGLPCLFDEPGDGKRRAEFVSPSSPAVRLPSGKRILLDNPLFQVTNFFEVINPHINYDVSVGSFEWTVVVAKNVAVKTHTKRSESDFVISPDVIICG